eukprot:12873614-Alexandrium_andersonii.AAC.1
MASPSAPASIMRFFASMSFLARSSDVAACSGALSSSPPPSGMVEGLVWLRTAWKSSMSAGGGW